MKKVTLKFIGLSLITGIGFGMLSGCEVQQYPGQTYHKQSNFWPICNEEIWEGVNENSRI